MTISKLGGVLSTTQSATADLSFAFADHQSGGRNARSIAWRLAVAAGLVLGLAPQTATAETVKIGLVSIYSGLNAEFGLQMERGMLLYQKMNPDAFGGHKIELIKRDSKNAAGDTAKTLVQELLTRDRVHILTGFAYSPDVLASAPLVNQAKVPLIILNAGTSWLTGVSPYITRVSFTMWHAGAPMGRYAAEKLKCKTAISAYTDYPPGKDSVAAFQHGFTAAGGKVIEGVPMGGPIEVPDYTPFLQRIKDTKPDCVYAFVPMGNHVGALLKTYANLGLREAGIRLVGPGDLTVDTQLPLLDKNAAGLITTSHYQADWDTPANKVFVAAWKKEYGATTAPDLMGVAGWDGMALIAHMIKTLNGKIDPDKAMDTVKGWKFASPRGPIQIDPATRDIIQDENVQEVIISDGRITVKLLDVIPQVKDPCKEAKVGRCAE